MLDDIVGIHRLDSMDALGQVAKFGEQLRYEVSLTPEFFPKDEILNVVYVGMGGSALAALYIPTWPTLRVPFEIVRNYDLPTYVGEKTLVVVSSHSGETEETVEALRQAEEKSAQIVVITSGGKLADIAKGKGYSTALLPEVPQSRYWVAYNLKALAVVLTKAGVANAGVEDLNNAGDFLQNSALSFEATVPTAHNPAKKMAQECIGKSVVVYAGPKLSPAAYKWKVGFNENAKQIAWFGQLPEVNHNEILGWLRHPEHKPYVVIDLVSEYESLKTQKRFEISERLLSGTRPKSYVVNAEGSNLLEQTLWAGLMGDFTTIYTAILSGEDPSPIKIIEKFKKTLSS